MQLGLAGVALSPILSRRRVGSHCLHALHSVRGSFKADDNSQGNKRYFHQLLSATTELQAADCDAQIVRSYKQE